MSKELTVICATALTTADYYYGITDDNKQTNVVLYQMSLVVKILNLLGNVKNVKDKLHVARCIVKQLTTSQRNGIIYKEHKQRIVV